MLADPGVVEAFWSRCSSRTGAPEALALGARVAYLWCPEGVIASPLSETVNRLLGDAVTSRNWTTMIKLAALAAEPRG